MIWRIVLWASIIWLAPLMYFVLKNETKFKKNLAVGVTLPYEGRTDSEVTARLAQFKRELGWVCLLLTALAIPGLLVSNFALYMSLWCLWIDLCIVLPYLPYVRCNRDLRRIKGERGWQRERTDTVVVDTSLLPPCRWLSPWLFVLPGAIALLPLVWDRTLWAVYAVDGACVLLFWLCYRYLYRNKSERVDGDGELTRTLTLVRRYNWGRVWIISAYCMAALNLAILLTRESPLLMVALILALGLLITGAVMGVEFHTRKLQERLTAGSGCAPYVDTDDQWIWGILYYNPRDRHLLINDRVGTNTSFNLARPAGKVLAGLLLIILLAMPFIGVFLDGLDTRPIHLAVSEGEISAVCGSTEYRVPLEDIAGAELLDTLPEQMTRTNGTGMEHLLKGSFSARGIGPMKVCLDPTAPPFLLLTTTDGRHYLFGCREAGVTESIYTALP